MSQPTGALFQIVSMSGVASASKTAFTNPLSVGARSATITNNDASVAITVATDSTGSPSISIAHGASQTFTISSDVEQAAGITYNGFAPGATMFNVSGNVTTQPTVVVSA